MLAQRCDAALVAGRSAGCSRRHQVVTQVTQPAQMLWANMSLHMSGRPAGADGSTGTRPWQVDGFLMFSCLGPDTLQELRALVSGLGLAGTQP